ncbi:MAG: translation elongation factor 4, partial [Kiritimatiellia bacterium]|nr:translation elongation factor 4 [Kiritimatiellia bacterium]
MNYRASQLNIMDNYSSFIRNFCIIAHIDHGKSTLADRMLQLTKTIDARDFRDQVLDSMDLERERGITIKCHPVTMHFQSADGHRYEFNLLDTPGHVDFTYEVSRSMAACEGALLLVDAAQGVEAQTVANAFLALEHNLKIIPVLNKIDLPTANVAEVSGQIEELLGISLAEGCLVSAKTGEGVQAMMELVTGSVPAPKIGGESVSTRALIFDSVYDVFRGVVPYVRVFEGQIKAGDRLLMLGTGCASEVKEVGVFTPKMTPVKVLRAGQVGYVVGTIKSPRDIRIGDTVTTSIHAAPIPLPGFKNIQPMVFSGVYPVNTADYEKLKLSLDRLALNDSAFTYQNEASVALGFGFRCGFLGLLHLEIVQERLRREYDLDIISTYPAVVYKVYLKDGTLARIDNPVHLPEPTRIERIEEPLIKAFIICRNEQISDLMKLIMDRRGTLDKTDSLDTKRVMLTCTLPLNEILVDFYDCLKSLSHGYASMDYELSGYAASDLVKVDILLNGEPVDAFSCLIHKSKAEARGRQMCAALKEVIPPHQFVIPVQAAIGKTIIARETIRALRKDVT